MSTFSDFRRLRHKISKLLFSNSLMMICLLRFPQLTGVFPKTSLLIIFKIFNYPDFIKIRVKKGVRAKRLRSGWTFSQKFAS